MSLISRKVPLLYLIIILIISATAISYFFLNPVRVVEKTQANNSAQIELIRSSHHKYTQPLMLIEVANEDPSLQPLKNSLESYYNSQKLAGKLTSASLYLRDLSYGKWMSINPDEQYSPGSMMKVVTLLAYLKDSEKDPLLLDRRIKFETHFSQLPQQTIVAKQLTPGQSYTIRELLESMIIDSDNDATVLLGSQANYKTYFSLFKDISLTPPGLDQKDYPITAAQFSRVFRVLFNSAYLSEENSDYALGLLTKSKFKDGLAKYLPENVQIAHKFGERFYGQDQQLHETGIIYLNNHPYLLTVMTRGISQNDLKEILSVTGQTVYDFMKVR